MSKVGRDKKKKKKKRGRYISREESKRGTEDSCWSSC